MLAFERNGSDAEDTMDAYRVFDGDDGKLERKGNVVIAWDKTPSEGERGQVHDCLGDAAE